MTTTRDELCKLAEAATPGPWEAHGTSIGAYVGSGDCRGCSGLLSPAHEPSCYYGEIAGAGEADAEFIAATDPDTIKALLAQLDRAEALIESIKELMGQDDQRRIGEYLARRRAEGDS